MKFQNANEAFGYYLDKIITEGVEFDDTRALFNVGFTIINPMDNHITDKHRKWKLDYAEAEWKWYESGKPLTSVLGDIYGKVPPIWKRMESTIILSDFSFSPRESLLMQEEEDTIFMMEKIDDFVNSNYGWQWSRMKQLDKAIEILKDKSNSRRAGITIFDGKELGDHTYKNDTPCTIGIMFYIVDERLNMSVYMRSNDLWYGFCNDQYCFSMLQQKVADALSIDVGEYYHHATNLHLYNNKL